MGVVFGISGFLLVFEWTIAAGVAALGIFAGLAFRSFDYDEGFHVHKDEISETERKWRKGANKGVKNHVS